MIKFNKKNLLVVKGSLAILSIIVLLGVGTYPLFSNISKINSEITDTRIQLAIYESQKNNIDATRKDYNQIKDKISNISTMFIKPDALLTTIDDLEKVASLSGVIQSISLQNYDEFSVNQTIEFTISATGSWQQILNYVGSLEKLDYYVSLYNTRIVTSGAKVTFSASAYVNAIE